MKVGLGLFNILSTDSAVGSLVVERIFPNVAPRTTTFPFIIYEVDGDTPNDTKSSVSVVDVKVDAPIYLLTKTCPADPTAS